jgi:hypothetical protein
MARRFNRKPLTDAERDARRKADRDRLEQAARALLTTEGWQRWIKVRASNGLSRYSVSNQWLIAIECHARGITPTYVAGFRAFLELNRCVRKGSKAIRILAPVTVKHRDEHDAETGEKKVFFRTVPVFDVSMTDPMPGKEPVPLAPPWQPICGDSHPHLIAPLVAHAPELGYRVEIRELPDEGPGGWCDPKRHEIVLPTGPRIGSSARWSTSSPTRMGSATPTTAVSRPRSSSTASPTSSAPPSASTSAASRSRTSPAGARTARSRRSASTPQRSTPSDGESKTPCGSPPLRPSTACAASRRSRTLARRLGLRRATIG